MEKYAAGIDAVTVARLVLPNELHASRLEMLLFAVPRILEALKCSHIAKSLSWRQLGDGFLAVVFDVCSAFRSLC